MGADESNGVGFCPAQCLREIYEKYEQPENLKIAHQIIAAHETFYLSYVPIL